MRKILAAFALIILFLVAFGLGMGKVASAGALWTSTSTTPSCDKYQNSASDQYCPPPTVTTTTTPPPRVCPDGLPPTPGEGAYNPNDDCERPPTTTTTTTIPPPTTTTTTTVPPPTTTTVTTTTVPPPTTTTVTTTVPPPTTTTTTTETTPPPPTTTTDTTPPPPTTTTPPDDDLPPTGLSPWWIGLAVVIGLGTVGLGLFLRSREDDLS